MSEFNLGLSHRFTVRRQDGPFPSADTPCKICGKLREAHQQPEPPDPLASLEDKVIAFHFKHQIVADYVDIICGCGDVSDRRADHIAHLQRDLWELKNDLREGLNL